MAINKFKMGMRAVVGGFITAGLGGLLAPFTSQLTFIPATKLLIQGLTPHVVIAYGLAYLVADLINERFLKN